MQLLKKKSEKTLCAEEGYLASQNSSKDEDLFNSIQSLELDEARYIEQKEHLTALLNKLETNAKEEVEKRKRKVEILNSEVADLKRRCEKFAGWINSESILECSQAGI